MAPTRRPTRLLAADLVCIRGGREVFSGLSFVLNAGQALAVSGPNGAGKSSLLRVIAGLVRLEAGRLTLEGGDALGLHFCHLAALRARSPRTAALLARLQAHVAAHAPRLAARPARDVVHFDFGGHNILAAGGRVTGVVDWEPYPGDRVFDLATLLFYEGYTAGAAATRARVWGRALALADAATVGIYLCHMIHRQTDWSLRHDDAATVARVLGTGAAVLRDLDRRLGRSPPA
jgi:energy-coupling factor transporter ATP-binding protein EcfA2